MLLYYLLLDICLAYKILILNDLHYAPNYTVSWNGQYYFWDSLAEFGKDSPLNLITEVLDHAAQENSIDLILVNGDFVQHSFMK